MVQALPNLACVQGITLGGLCYWLDSEDCRCCFAVCAHDDGCWNECSRHIEHIYHIYPGMLWAIDFYWNVFWGARLGGKLEKRLIPRLFLNVSNVVVIDVLFFQFLRYDLLTFDYFCTWSSHWFQLPFWIKSRHGPWALRAFFKSFLAFDLY